MAADQEDFESSFRIDFQFLRVVPQQDGAASVEIVFDPERYEVAVHKGEQMLFDKMDEFLIPMSEVAKMLREALSMTPTGGPATLGDADQYVSDRLEIPRSGGPALDNRKYKLVDKSDEYLQRLTGRS